MQLSALTSLDVDQHELSISQSTGLQSLSIPPIGIYVRFAEGVSSLQGLTALAPTKHALGMTLSCIIMI